MAEFTLKDTLDLAGSNSQHVIVVTFDNPAYVPEKTETVTSSVADVDDDGNLVLDDNGEPQYSDKEIEVTTEASGEPTLTFEQAVILPDSGTDKAAQAYADDYEKSFNDNYKES